MFIDEEAVCRLAPHRGAMFPSRVTSEHGAPTERGWFGCRVYKHCTPKEWGSLLTQRSVLHTKRSG
jgi:hypothetical protein